MRFATRYATEERNECGENARNKKNFLVQCKMMEEKKMDALSRSMNWHWEGRADVELALERWSLYRVITLDLRLRCQKLFCSVQWLQRRRQGTRPSAAGSTSSLESGPLRCDAMPLSRAKYIRQASGISSRA